MKIRTLPGIFLGLALCSAALFAFRPAASSTAPRDRIGIYDSRAVAYAHFWQPAECAKRDALIATAKAAKAAGDPKRVKEIEQRLENSQARAHLQVFSTAPADDAMAALAPQLPALQNELGVSRLISKWDKKTLRLFRTADQVDVTDRLVREFITPTQKQQKTIDSIKATKPQALWKARLLLVFGGM